MRIFTLALLAGLPGLATADFPKDVRARGLAATVRVKSATDGTYGSGALFARSGPHGYVLTASHVVPRAKGAEVAWLGGKPVAAEVVARAAEVDLAVLRVIAVEGMPAPMKLAVVGAVPKQIISLGWEKGDAPTALDELLKGKVRLRKPGETNAVGCWEIERTPAVGRSGGPLLDDTGAIVGVASGHDGTTGYFIHADEVHSFLRRNGLKWLTDDER